MAWVHGYQVLFNIDRTEARLAKATAAIENAVRLAPDDPYVQLERAYYYYFCFRDYTRAAGILQTLLAWQPNDAATHYALANIQRRQGKWAASMDSYQRASDLDPQNLDYFFQLWNIALRGRRYPTAIAAAERIAALNMTDPWRKWDAAWTRFWATGSMREIDAFVARTSETPSAQATYWRKIAALTRGDFAEAIRLDATQELGNRQPYVTEAGSAISQAIEMAVTFAAQGDLASARARVEPHAVRLRDRLKTESANAVGWAQLGMVESLLGDKESALRNARKALELEPESIDAVAGVAHRVRLAFVYTWIGDKDAAIAEYGALLRLPTLVPLVSVHEMRASPLYFPLRGDPRFEALIKDPKNNEPLF